MLSKWQENVKRLFVGTCIDFALGSDRMERSLGLYYAL